MTLSEVKKSVRETFAKKDLTNGEKVATLRKSDVKKSILVDLPSAMQILDSLRIANDEHPASDIDLSAFLRERYGFSAEADDKAVLNSFYDLIDLKPFKRNLHGLMTFPEFPESYRWLVPELIREAIRLGLRRTPIYPSLIYGETSVSQTTIKMPSINLSDATPAKIGEAVSIPVGSISYGQKDVTIDKYGTGVEITDEVAQYVSLDVIGLYLQDVGVRMNMALDTKAVDTLINGDQADGSEALGIIGVDNVGNRFEYIDILRAWMRLSQLNKLPTVMLSTEVPALEILQLEEFKGFAGETTTQTIDLKTPIPRSQNYIIHGAVNDDDLLLLVDGNSAMLKLNATALRVEMDRSVQRQLSGVYVSMTTGFTTVFRDARLGIDAGLAWSGNKFPSYMDVATFQKNPFK